MTTSGIALGCCSRRADTSPNSRMGLGKPGESRCKTIGQRWREEEGKGGMERERERENSHVRLLQIFQALEKSKH